MLARYAGASLALFAFAIVIVAGLWARNPVTTTLSRSLFALFAFFLIGFVLGAAAQMVIDEHRARANAELERKYHAAHGDAPSMNIDQGVEAADGSVLET